ncbi:MAG: hypothetical protein LR011_07850 [Verrucomicrobia bacterium]|nr:hypothetical protein [Verrucomicrobiota bacterium]
MNYFEVLTLLIIGYLLVCLQLTFDGFFLWMHGYIWFPCLLMAYSVVKQPSGTTYLLCFVMGYWIDSLSMNPLGLSILSFLGSSMLANKGYRNWAGDPYLSIFAPGLILGGAFPLFSLGIAFLIDLDPLTGWRVVVGILLSAVTIGFAAPVFLRLVDHIMNALQFKPAYRQEPYNIREISRSKAGIKNPD